MRLKKTLYAVVMFLAVASMILPSVGAQVRGPKRFALNRSFAQEHRSQLQQAQNNYRNKPHTPRGTSKPLANNGLLKTSGSAREWIASGRILDADQQAAALLDARLGGAAKAGDDITRRLMHPQSVVVTPELRAKLQLRPSGAVTETASARASRLATKFAEQKRGLTRGAGARPSAVLPSSELADDSSLSAVGFVGFAGTEDFFDEAVLLGDLDGVHNLRNNFDTSNVARELVDTQAKVEDDVLLPDETYTATVVSGHNAANGFNAPTDFNVFYTATSAGFINILGDTVCDGDLFADTVLGVVAAANIVVPNTGGRTFSNSAAITGLAVNTDAEYDGDLATDEIVWFTVFDPEFGQPAVATSALCFMIDTDGDDIPDPAGVGVFATSTSVSVAGVAIDSFGDVYWHLTDFVIGRVLKAWDVDEDRFPDVGFTTFNFPDDKPTASAAALDFFTAADAVDMTVDRYNSLYLQVSGGIGAPQGAGLGASAVVSYTDRCGDFDSITGFIPRPNELADTDFRVFAADQDVAQPAGAGAAPPTLVIPELQIDYAGAYRGLAADWDDNIYVAIGAVPAGQAGDPSPFTGSILRIPDNNCDRVGDAVDLNGNSDFGEADDYRWVDAPFNPPELTPNGINGVHFGPLYSLERAGQALGDDDAIQFRFDDFDGEANNVAGGVTDLLFATACDNVGTNGAGGPVGFEWLFCNTAWTGFRLGSNGIISFETLGPLADDPIVFDLSPTVVEFLSTAPAVAPLWTDLDPNEGGQFSLHHLGFAATDAFIIQTINVPAFGFGGVGVGVDPFGFPKRGQVNSFDITFYDDQDAWDDVRAEEEQGGTNDTTNLDQTVNNDNDGVSFPAGISLRPEDPTRILDRNGDGDVTDENLASFAQEGVGRTVPEQGPFKLVYHQVEVAGTAAQPVLVGFTTGFDGVFNTGTIPPGLCETNLSAASPAPDNPFFMNGAIGMGTEPSLYEYFNSGSYGTLNPDGTTTPAAIDVDLRQEVSPDCITRPERFLDTTSAECLLFKGSNIPVGLFCQTIEVTAVGGNQDPFLGPANLQINGFLFPMPTTGENAICPQFCGQTAPLCRAGKSVTYDVIFKFDENGDGIVDATIPFGEPDVVVTNENQINLTIDFSQTTLCGGNVQVCVIATYGFGDDNKYFELQQLDNDEALEVAPVQLVCSDAADIGVRQPVVLSIAPDTVDCDNPDDPDNVEDVQIAGLCFLGDITSAFLTLTPDGSGAQIPLTNVVNVQTNIVTATVPLSQLTERDTPYYVFVVRGDGARSTNYPNPLGFDVTFTCVSGQTPTTLHLTTCKVVRVSGGKFVLQVNGVGFVPNDTIVLLGDTPCRKNKYPSRFINPSDGTTTRINCSGGIKRLLPAVVRVKTVSTGQLSDNSLNCDFSN